MNNFGWFSEGTRGPVPTPCLRFPWGPETKQRHPDYFSEGYLNLEQRYFCDVGSVEVVIFPQKKALTKRSENFLLLSMTNKILHHELVPTHISQSATTPSHILYSPNTKNLFQFSNHVILLHNSVLLLYPRFGRLCSLFKCYSLWESLPNSRQR